MAEADPTPKVSVFKRFLYFLFPNLENRDKDFTRYFFRSIRRISYIFFVVGFIATLVIYYSTGDIFRATAVFFILVWLVVFLRYFMWAVYHFNVNYGITQKDWDRIEEARERKRKKLDVDPSELLAPDQNPYRSQTFGLPPGTVRGMIALTILFGALTILISTMGMDRSQIENSMLGDQFEFFKTAFLMMIAFYFGDKSLRYLQRRWKDPNQTDTSVPEGRYASKQNETGEPVSDLAMDDKEFETEETEFAARMDRTNTTSPGGLKSLLNTAAITTDEEPISKIIEENKFVEKNIYRKILSDEDIRRAVAELKDTENIVLLFPVLKAITEVESGGRGHLEDGRAKILFEGHKFWYWLKKFGKNPEDYVKGNEDILYEKWTKQFYKGGAAEYQRLERAMQIDKKAAVYATSWGLFQILGENLEENIKSRINTDPSKHNDDLYIAGNLDDFMNKQDASERYHLLDFLAFIKTKQIEGKPLVSYVSGNDETLFNWEKFAYGYNGSGYKQNEYDTKLNSTYCKYRDQEVSVQPASKTRIPIIDAGHGGIINGQYVTPGKRYKFTGPDQNNLEVFEGIINRGIAQKLIKRLKDENIAYYDLNSTDPNDMPLAERVKVADRLFAGNKSYYYLSIHCNTASNESEGSGNKASGFEIFTSVGQTQSDLFAKIAAQVYLAKFPNRKFRGVKEADFYVLKQTDCPAFLVENLFYDNYEEALYLSSEKGQQDIADCLFDVIRGIC